MKMAEKFQNTVGRKKLLLKSNFSFSHSVFTKLAMQTCKNQGLLGKRLTYMYMNDFICEHNYMKPV